VSDPAPVRLHVDVDGQGPPVLLAHGFGGSARNFLPQARALRAVHRVLRWDARGHARSEAPDDPRRYEAHDFVADARRVLDDAGTTRAVVGGLSMGAVTALQLALAHPEQVRGLVLASFPAGPGSRHGISSIALAFADAIERDGLEAAGRRFVWGPDAGLDERAAALVRQGFLEHPPHGLVHTLRGYVARFPTPDDLAAELRGLRVPTLVVAGEHDAGSRPPSERLAALLPQARLVVVEDAGHVVNLHQPRRFNAALSEWLAGLPLP
jgi:pimeloyl-ACP methyl ester carboxylesterase